MTVCITVTSAFGISDDGSSSSTFAGFVTYGPMSPGRKSPRPTVSPRNRPAESVRKSAGRRGRWRRPQRNTARECNAGKVRS
jgi:hypothetical protein